MFVVFDLDGTLSCDKHRAHLLPNPSDGGCPDNYREYHAACDRDPPIMRTLLLLGSHLDAGHSVEIWTGRSESEREKTEAWLDEHGVPPALLARMRPIDGDVPSVDLKRTWLRESRELGCAPVLAYDDRPEILAMWAAEGVACVRVGGC